MNYLGTEIQSTETLISTLRKHYAGAKDIYHRYGYWVNGVYYPNANTDDRSREWQRRIKPLREVTGRAVDFFALKMLPGEISIDTDQDPLKAAVEQVLKWSNFEEKKKLYLTDLALTGDLFLKVNSTMNKVFFTFVPPEDVSVFNEDWRGYLTDIRIEYEIEDENGALITYTEFWNKEYFAVWQHNLGKGRPLEDLGTPLIYEMLSQYRLDFCPFVHIKFKDIGQDNSRGMGCVTSSLPVIEEACRQATIQAKNAFRDKQTFVLSADSVDANNFTLDPIKVVKHTDVLDTSPTESQQDVTPDDIWQAPAMSKVTSLLTGIDWSGLQGIIDATMEELNQEIPALRYWAIKDATGIAAKTVGLLLDAALSQARESARSFTSGIVRCCQIALTMGIYAGLFQSALGNYAAGDFDFSISAGQAFEPSSDERAITLKTLMDAKIPQAVAMKMAGYGEDEIQETTDASAIDHQQKTEDLKAALSSINQPQKEVKNANPARSAV
jgi:hypothetical protein